ncbi:hypothetical protein [Paenibacillus humicola]|uniref:hypothetical protein n=1 Tax=Paenibacillus humicola TaxID=3110540 RepID=UPI00237A7410|nr:hypothetical protein [Paenibacillus humicola]
MSSDNHSVHIRIEHFGLPPHDTTAGEMASLAGGVFPLSERVENAAGEAFDFHAWYSAWRAERRLGDGVPAPTHLKTEAADSFEALIPWEQLGQAAFQCGPGGEPLPKGGPVRLYVPDGSSACLNVKGVVLCRFIHEEAERGSVTYGFKRTFSPQELRQKR